MYVYNEFDFFKAFKTGCTLNKLSFSQVQLFATKETWMECFISDSSS